MSRVTMEVWFGCEFVPTKFKWFCSENGGRIFLRNDVHLSDYTFQRCRRPQYGASLPWKPQTSRRQNVFKANIKFQSRQLVRSMESLTRFVTSAYPTDLVVTFFRHCSGVMIDGYGARLSRCNGAPAARASRLTWGYCKQLPARGSYWYMEGTSLFRRDNFSYYFNF
jgi:hypothetical protein